MAGSGGRSSPDRGAVYDSLLSFLHENPWTGTDGAPCMERLAPEAVLSRSRVSYGKIKELKGSRKDPVSSFFSCRKAAIPPHNTVRSFHSIFISLSRTSSLFLIAFSAERNDEFRVVFS